MNAFILHLCMAQELKMKTAVESMDVDDTLAKKKVERSKVGGTMTADKAFMRETPR